MAERLLAARIYRLERLPWGLDLAYDVERRAPDVRIRTVFDVGANVGQSAVDFARLFPDATIWSFEPFEEPFRELERATRSLGVRCHKLAMGSEPGTANVAACDQSVHNTLLGASDLTAGEAAETVEVSTIDTFTAEHGVDHIDLLKVDTEGFDLEVLKGAEKMLRAGAVTFVQVEAGMTRHNPKHVPFETLTAHLEERGYVLFAIYGQMPEWTGEARLRFANPVFAVEAVANRAPRA